MAGRKPKPTALKKLEGNPGKRKLNTKDPVPGKGMSDCPKWLLPEAKKFKFPVFYNGQTIEEIRWDKENTVETVCLLSNRKPDAKIRIDVNLEDYYRIKDKKGGVMFVGVSNEGEAFGIGLDEVDRTKNLIAKINDRHIFPHERLI